MRDQRADRHFNLQVMGSYIRQSIVKQRVSTYVRPYWSTSRRTYGGFSDSRYYLPSAPELEEMLLENPVFPDPGLGEGFDCDDYSFVLKGSFSLYGKEKALSASICLGIAWGRFSWRKEYHACNWVLTDEYTFSWIEPLTHTLHPVTDCKGGLTLMLV